MVLGPGLVWVDDSVPMEGTTSDLPPVHQTPHLTLT